MRNKNTKIYFLLLAAGALCCAGCESTHQARFNDLLQARQLASALNGLSPGERDQAAVQIYSAMQTEQAEDARVRAQILSEGFQNAGRIMAESSRPTYNYIQPVQLPAVQPLVIPPPRTAPPINPIGSFSNPVHVHIY
jgi:hypothetical protein